MTDAAIVGAGLAGLAAARTLEDAGASTVVLEARDRVGGRTLSETIGAGVFNVGGQWLGPTQHRMARLVQEFGLATFPTHHAGRKIFDDGTRVRTYAGNIPALPLVQLLVLQRAMRRLDRLRRTVPPDRPHNAVHAERWDGETVETWKRRHVPSALVRGLLDAALRVVFGAEPRELSLLHVLAYLNAGGGLESLIGIEGGAQETRFVGGAQQVALRLAERLGERVVLAAPVAAIEQVADGVAVHAAGRTVRARYAIVAVPPPLAARIRFTPALPALRDQLLQRFPMGATTKVLATYARPFWREQGFSGEAVASDGPVTATFDNTSHDGAQPALVAFVVGEPARAWGARAADVRRQAILLALARFFGPDAGAPLEYREQDWAAEPWTRGCPVASPAPGALVAFGDALRAPTGRLHWAGTETATEWNGYMEGAVESGERAAREVLERRTHDG